MEAGSPVAVPPSKPLGVLLPAVSPVEGLGVPPGEVPWLGRPLGLRQERAFRLAGVEPGPDDPSRERVVLAADAAATPPAVLGLLRHGRAQGEPTAFVPGGELGVLARSLRLGRDGVLAAWLPPGAPLDAAALAALVPLPLDPAEQAVDVPVPAAAFGAATLRVPLADRLILPAGHWVQVLWANLLGLGPFLWKEFLGANAVAMAFRLASAAVRARSLRPARLATVMGRRARGVRVHPSAVVEGSWLGDGVEVGAQAVVRGALLAEGARVGDQALVEYAVLGRGAVVERQAAASFSVLDAGSACAGSILLGLVGSGAVVGRGAVLPRAGGETRVLAGGARVPAPLGLAVALVAPRVQAAARNAEAGPGAGLEDGAGDGT